MKLIRQVNLLENKKLIRKLNAAALILMVVFYILFAALADIIGGSHPIGTPSLLHIVLTTGMFFGLVILHELVHGAFFKLFSPENKIQFGFKNGMAYAASPNSIYTRNQFIWIAIAPFIAVTLLLMLSLYVNVFNTRDFTILAAAHAAACVGDFYYVFLLNKYPRKFKVKDTETGMEIYSDE